MESLKNFLVAAVCVGIVVLAASVSTVYVVTQLTPALHRDRDDCDRDGCCKPDRGHCNGGCCKCRTEGCGCPQRRRLGDLGELAPKGKE